MATNGEERHHARSIMKVINLKQLWGGRGQKVRGYIFSPGQRWTNTLHTLKCSWRTIGDTPGADVPFFKTRTWTTEDRFPIICRYLFLPEPAVPPVFVIQVSKHNGFLRVPFSWQWAMHVPLFPAVVPPPDFHLKPNFRISVVIGKFQH